MLAVAPEAAWLSVEVVVAMVALEVVVVAVVVVVEVVESIFPLIRELRDNSVDSCNTRV